MVMPGDILVDVTQGEGKDATGIYWEDAKDADEHPTVHRTISNDEELSSLKCQ